MIPSGADGLYLTREEIESNSPSRRDGISLKEETRLRNSYSSFVRDLGFKLQLNKETIVTAMVLSHRFFLRQSLAKNDRWTIATICLFISAKGESNRLDLKRLIIASYEMLFKKVIADEHRQQVFDQYKAVYSSGEKLVLATLNFDLDVELPYLPLITAMQKFILDESTQAQFPSVSWKYLQDTFWTTLCLQYQPRQLAAAAFFHAAKVIKMDVESNEETWFQEFDVTPSQLNDIFSQMDEFYREKKLSKGSIGETSNSGALVQQPVPIETEGGSSNVNDDGSLEDKSRLEGVEKDSPDREAGDDQEDSSVRDPAAKTSGDCCLVVD